MCEGVVLKWCVLLSGSGSYCCFCRRRCVGLAPLVKCVFLASWGSSHQSIVILVELKANVCCRRSGEIATEQHLVLFNYC